MSCKINSDKSYGFVQNNNILLGIIIFTIFGVIGFIIYPNFFFFYWGDLYDTLGAIVGIRLTIKNIKPNQSFIKTGIIVGGLGGLLSAILRSIFMWIINAFEIIVLLFSLLIFAPFTIILGILCGYLMGYIYSRKTGGYEENGSSLF